MEAPKGMTFTLLCAQTSPAMARSPRARVENLTILYMGDV